jgi:hypothetical protein
MPTSFTNPQFWGEDILFYNGSYLDGWASIATMVAGYRVVIQFLVAVLASYFSPAAAPAIYNYAAFALTLLVVWMVTSPRLDLPHKPLLALAVVIVPMGYEELGSITNIQWVLPIGAFAILFMRAPLSFGVFIGEAVFIGVTALSGPFSIFLMPMFFLRTITAGATLERRRLAILTLIVAIGAAIQAMTIIQNPGNLDGIAPAPYSWQLWVNLPLSHILTSFGPVSKLFIGTMGVIIGACFCLAAVVLAYQAPYRTQKIFMLLFAAAIALSGMYKYRAALESQ